MVTRIRSALTNLPKKRNTPKFSRLRTCLDRKLILVWVNEDADQTSCHWLCCGDGGVVFAGFAVGSKEPFGRSFRN
jgi:hypothetical protein